MRIIDPDSTGNPPPQDKSDGPGPIEGEANLRLLTRDGKLLIHFGKPVLWIGLTKPEAFRLADGLRQLASKL